MYAKIIWFVIFFYFKHISATPVITPNGPHNVNSNIQLMCTDDIDDAKQPEWISPSNNVIQMFQPQKIDTAMCKSEQACDYDKEKYCDNAFASCVEGRCLCQKFGYDQCSCLVSLGDCHMVRTTGSFNNIAVATSARNDTLEYTSCESNKLSMTEVHVIAMEYGIISPEYTNVSVNIINRNTSQDKNVVLVLVSDRLVFWRVHIENNETLHRLVHLSRYQDENNTVISGHVSEQMHKPKDAPYGIGDDARYGGRTVDMLLYLEENYGYVSSFTGTYTAKAWSITIDLSKNEDEIKKLSKVMVIEKVYPWQTKLTLMGLQNDEDYGKYSCKCKHSESNITIYKKENPISKEKMEL